MLHEVGCSGNAEIEKGDLSSGSRSPFNKTTHNIPDHQVVIAMSQMFPGRSYRDLLDFQ